MAARDSDARKERVVIVWGVHLILGYDETSTGVSDIIKIADYTKTAISLSFLDFVVCNCIIQTRLPFSRRQTTHQQDTQIRLFLL